MTPEWCSEVLKAAIENIESQKSSILIIGSQFTSDVFINDLKRTK